MAIDKRIKGMEVNIYPDARHRLEWYSEEVPAPYKEYYSVRYNKRHVADIFRGKTVYYGIVFGKTQLRSSSLYYIEMCIAGFFVHPGN